MKADPRDIQRRLDDAHGGACYSACTPWAALAGADMAALLEMLQSTRDKLREVHRRAQTAESHRGIILAASDDPEGAVKRMNALVQSNYDLRKQGEQLSNKALKAKIKAITDLAQASTEYVSVRDILDILGPITEQGSSTASAPSASERKDGIEVDQRGRKG